MLPSYRNQSVDCKANQLTGFYIMGTLFVNGLIQDTIFNPGPKNKPDINFSMSLKFK